MLGRKTIIKPGKSTPAITVFVVLLATFCLATWAGNLMEVLGHPSANLFSHTNNLTPNDERAEKSFQQFISAKPSDSVIIGEIKPNASEIELRYLKEKIADAIMGIQEMEKSLGPLGNDQVTGAECFIEIKRVEKAAGKCQKLSNGLPICQSEHYMALSNECS